MKRLRYDRYGGPEVMRLAEFEPPRPGPDEVLVRVRAAASNPLDWKMRNGEMKLLTGCSFPRAMGHDFAGVVEAVGAGVTRVKAGGAIIDIVPTPAKMMLDRAELV
jgi:NADPH:quinone reductase-like Zn-dependent oxidoreductase